MFRLIDRTIRRIPDNSLCNSLVSSSIAAFSSVYEKRCLHIQRSRIDETIYQSGDPLISIYIPTFNRKKLLVERSIQSVLDQTYKNFELIVSNDGSTDGTSEAVNKIKDPRVILIEGDRSHYRYPNKAIYHWFTGSVTASNLALQQVRGQWIAMNGDDDYWTEDHLESLLRCAQQSNKEFVSSNILVRKDGKEEIWGNETDPKDKTRIGSQQTWLYRDYLNFFKYNIHCWRKSYFRPNDSDFTYRVWRGGVDIGFLDKTTVVYEPRPGESEIGSKVYTENADEIVKTMSKF
jgi:O-antigen biosynthesis protein